MIVQYCLVFKTGNVMIRLTSKPMQTDKKKAIIEMEKIEREDPNL